MRCWPSLTQWGGQPGVKGDTFSLAALFFAVAYGLVGCAALTSRAPEPPLREATAEELTALLETRERALQTVKGLFTATISGEGIPIAQTVYGTIFFRRPNALRLRGFTRFGGELFDFALHANRFVLWLPREGKLFSGDPAELDTREEITQPLRLSMLAMSGIIGIAPVAQDEWVVLIEDEDRYRLDIRAAADRDAHERAPLRQIWFDRQSFVVVREDRFTKDGQVEETLYLEDFREVQQEIVGEEVAAAEASSAESGVLRLPYKITAKGLSGKGHVRITFSELIPNVPLTDGEFRLTAGAPSGRLGVTGETLGG